MHASTDLCFSGNQEVILMNWQDEFVPYPPGSDGVTTYLAGSFCEKVDVARAETAELSGLFGQFAILRHDRRARTVVLITDRFGMFPFYMAHDEQRIYLSTDFYQLARQCDSKNSPDFGALSDMLAFNVPFGERTTSSKIRSFSGSVEVTIDLDTLAIRSRKLWNPVHLLAHADLRFDQVKDQLVDLFLEGVRLATAGHETTSVTLSGGADSRCLLAGSLHIGKETFTYSTGVPGSRALSYARRMADLCGVHACVRPLDENFVADFGSLMQQCNDTLQGMSFSSELEAMWLRQGVAPDGVLLHGGFAELYKIGKMHDYHFDSKLKGMRGDAVSEHLWQRFAKRYEQRKQSFAPACRAALGHQAQEHLAAKVRHYQADLDTPGVLQMVYIDEFLGKVVKASWQMWRQRIPTLFPFAYPPLVDLILRVRSSDKVGNHFVVQLLKHTNKRLARFPDSNTGVSIGASWARREAVHVIDYATKRLFAPKRAFDHQDFSHWLSSMPMDLDDLFDGLQAEHSGFEMYGIRRLIRDCRAGNDMSSRTLHILWSWSLLNRARAAGRGDQPGSDGTRSTVAALQDAPGEAICPIDA